MTEITAKLSSYRVSPRKVRLVTDLVCGKKIADALSQLTFLGKKSAPAIAKLLKSAISNAKNNSKIDTENTDLYVKSIRVDESTALKRWKPVSRGMAHPFKRRTSHISVVLTDKPKKSK